MVTCAVNGFGRIGRLVFRYAWEDPLLDIIHVNDLCSVESAAYLIKYDSVHGTWDKEVEVTPDGNGFTVDGKLVTFSREADFTKVNWSGMSVEMVMECTGKFLKVDTLSPYFDKCGVKRVVVSAPVKETGALNVVLGCNHGLLTEELKVCVFFFNFVELSPSVRYLTFIAAEISCENKLLHLSWSRMLLAQPTALLQ